MLLDHDADLSTSIACVDVMQSARVVSGNLTSGVPPMDLHQKAAIEISVSPAWVMLADKHKMIV